MSTNSVEWWNLLGKFQQASAQLDEVMTRLQQRESVVRHDKALSNEFDQIMRRGAELQSTITKSLQTIQQAINWLKGAAEYIPGLGALPLVPIVGIATVTASLAAVTKFLTDAWQTLRKADELARLQAGGLSASEAGAVVDRVFNQGTVASGIASSLVSSVAQPLLIGVVAWFVIKHIINKAK